MIDLIGTIHTTDPHEIIGTMRTIVVTITVQYGYDEYIGPADRTASDDCMACSVYVDNNVEQKVLSPRQGLLASERTADSRRTNSPIRDVAKGVKRKMWREDLPSERPRRRVLAVMSGAISMLFRYNKEGELCSRNDRSSSGATDARASDCWHCIV